MILATVGSVLLTILKVIGIILLVILGLILLIVLIVLFSPISYRLSAVHNEEETKAKVKVSFLIVKALAGYTKGEGLDYSVKALFFKILPRDHKDDSDDEDLLEEYLENLDDDDETPLVEATDTSSEEMSSGELPEPDFESDGTATSVQDLNDESNLEFTEEAESNDSEESEESAETAETVDETETQEKISLKQKIDATVDKVSDKVDEALDKADEKLDVVDKKYNELLVKADHVGQFLDKDFVERTIIRALKILKRLFGTIKPKKSKGYLHMGLKSSADTGMMLGKIAAFYPLYGRWLTIEPDFFNKVIEGDIDIKGRIYLFRIVFPAIRMVLTRDFWRTYKLAKKI